MSNIAIRVQGISKKYRLGGKRGGYSTLRDSFSQAFSAPSRVMRSLFERVKAKRSAAEETLWALRDVEFEVPRGQVVGLIGRNGAGKSTLLKILSRITDPTSGFAEIHGRVGSLLEVGTGFHPELSGRENIYLNGAILGMRRTEIDRKFDEIVAFAEVERFIDTAVKHYSSGMYLRLAFAVAAHLEPEILLVDEVLAVGDVAFQKKCIGRMENVANEGRTVLFVSHNMGAVRSLCNRGIFLQDGGVLHDGDIGKCIEAYYSALGINSGGGEGQAVATRGCFGPVVLNDGSGNTIHQADPFEIATTIRINKPVSGFYFYCMIEDMMGRELVCLKESSTSFQSGEFTPGEYRIRTAFPPLWFVPGLYSASFKLQLWGDGGVIANRHLSDKFPLDVGGEGSSGSSTGNVLLQPQVNWSVEAGTPV